MSIEPINRRHFAASLAAGAFAAAPMAATPLVGAQNEEVEPPLVEPPPIDPVALVLERVKEQYPDRLEAEHFVQIRRQIERHQAISRVLNQYPLTNADEPATVFAAYRREQG